MLNVIMMLFQLLKLIFLLPLWLVFALLFASLLVVSLSMLMILLIAYLVLTWLSDIILHNEQVLVSMQAELEQSTQKSEEEKYNIQELSPFLKSLRLLCAAVHKMVFVEVPRLFTFLFGIRK